jgi:hypothetical protein
MTPKAKRNRAEAAKVVHEQMKVPPGKPPLQPGERSIQLRVRVSKDMMVAILGFQRDHEFLTLAATVRELIEQALGNKQAGR